MSDEDAWSGSEADPDEHGYGHYEVEEYTGDASLRPALGDAPLFPRDDLVGHVPTLPDDDVVDDDPFASPPSAPAAGEPPPVVRTGRVAFADRNWRVPTIVALVVAVVVLGAVVLLLPDNGVVQEDRGAVAELRTQPVKQWDEDLDGFASGMVADEASLYVVVATRTVTRLVAFDLGSGDERWTTDLGAGTSSATGSVVLADDRLAVVIDGATSPGVFAVLEPSSGDIRWQTTLEPGAADASFVSESFFSTTDPDGGFVLTPFDVGDKRLGAPVSADAFFVVGDDVFVDDAGTLGRRPIDSFEADGSFSFRHAGELAAVTVVDGDAVVAVGESVIRLDDSGAERYSFEPAIGIVRSLTPMEGGLVLAGSATRMRAISVDGADAEPATGARSGVRPLLVRSVDDEELVIAYAGADSGVSDAEIRVMRIADDDFEQVSTIALTSADGAPAIAVVGSTLSTTSAGATPRFIAADIPTGERLWSISLADGDIATLGGGGLIVLSREDDESVVAFSAPAG